jgi:hypothetical protein
LVQSCDPFEEAPALRSLDARLTEARWRTLHAIRVALGRAR